ncbi:hypothetical protein [Spiroplasma endosymbiont of Virgichneumon dumeticola]|uniref:hypothetical protein n=1 Tax=Spiroplasma endosymbiont of Virgichneumon dumeticola TaxID=3139323 RepID=UPI0035C8F7C1
MQKPKQEKVLLKCIVKDCNKKVLIKLQSTDLENTSIQFFKMCKKHQLDFNNKVKEIKEYYDNKIKIKE